MNERRSSTTDATVWLPAVQQQVFRRLLDCFAYPGRIAGGDFGHDALIALLATLLDGETSVADPHALIAAADWPKLQARRDPADRAAFVVADGTRAPDFSPCRGTLESPERGATLVLTVTALGEGRRLRLSGPGVDDHARLAVTGWHPDWITARAEWVAAFPLGVDIVLCDGARVAALPRTTRIEMEAS